jgi:hypothetical protein
MPSFMIIGMGKQELVHACLCRKRISNHQKLVNPVFCHQAEMTCLPSGLEPSSGSKSLDTQNQTIAFSQRT